MLSLFFIDKVANYRVYDENGQQPGKYAQMFEEEYKDLIQKPKYRQLWDDPGIDKDVEKAHKFALEKFAGDLLAVADSLERGLELSNPDDEAVKPMREGVELTLKLLLDTLARHQLVPVDPQGEPFNPEHHQAMAMEESTHAEPGSVLKVFQKGYLLNGRLLRPAMVVVSKAPAETPPSIDEKA